MIQIPEGKFIMSTESLNLEEILNNIKLGYIQIYVKEGGKIHEGYLFFENGKVVGAYYTDNKDVEIFGDKDVVLDLLNKENKSIDVYEYTPEKMDVIKWLAPEIFKLKDEKVEVKEESTSIDIKDDDKFNGKYVKETISMPILDEPIARDVKDITPFLQENKLVVINIYNKKGTENAYLFYRGKNPILAYYECEKGSLFGQDAYEKIEEMLNNANNKEYIIDIYNFDENKLKVLVELYPKLKLENESENEEDNTTDESDFELNETFDEVLSREELLKKLGIKEPDEDWIENVLEELVRPDDEFLNNLKKELEKRIKEDILNLDGVKDVNVDINVKWENGRYYISGDVNVIRKKLFGIIKKDIDPAVIKLIIDNAIKNTVPKDERYTTHISINID